MIDRNGEIIIKKDDIEIKRFGFREQGGESEKAFWVDFLRWGIEKLKEELARQEE